MSKIKFNIYSDGASFNNGYKNPDLPQFCSCGYVICLGERIITEGSVPLGDNTISYAELVGMMIVLRKTIRRIEKLNGKLPKPYSINIHSDSQFVIKGASEWLPGWVKRGWKNSSGNEVAYKDIWEDLYKNFITNPDYDLTFTHVKGHTKNQDFNSLMNDKCDKLAVAIVSDYKKENGYK